MTSTIMFCGNSMFDSAPLLTDSPDLQALNFVANSLDDGNDKGPENGYCGNDMASAARISSSAQISQSSLTATDVVSLCPSIFPSGSSGNKNSSNNRLPDVSHARASSDVVSASLSHSFLAVTEADMADSATHHPQYNDSNSNADLASRKSQLSTQYGENDKRHDSGNDSSSNNNSNNTTPSHNLYIASLPPNCNDNMLLNLFEPFGPIVSAKVMLHRGSSRCKGYGFVFFKFREDAERAQTAMIGYVVGGNRIQVRHARPTSTNTLVHDAARNRTAGERSESTATSRISTSNPLNYHGCYGATPHSDSSMTLLGGSILVNASTANALVTPAVYPLLQTGQLMPPAQSCYNSMLPYYAPNPPTTPAAPGINTGATSTATTSARLQAIMNNTKNNNNSATDAALALSNGVQTAPQSSISWPGMAAPLPSNKFFLPSQQQQQQQQVVYMLVPMQQSVGAPGLVPYS